MWITWRTSGRSLLTLRPLLYANAKQGSPSRYPRFSGNLLDGQSIATPSAGFGPACPTVAANRPIPTRQRSHHRLPSRSGTCATRWWQSHCYNPALGLEEYFGVAGGGTNRKAETKYKSKVNSPCFYLLLNMRSALTITNVVVTLYQNTANRLETISIRA